MREVTIIAGPCAIETKNSFFDLAKQLKALGVTHLRGGAFKPRTSPDSFQGLGEEGLLIMRDISTLLGMKCVSEIMDAEDIPLFNSCVDIIQVGSRNMQNFSLLKKLAEHATAPILLKRSSSATYEEYLSAAKYLQDSLRGVILCERGIRTYERYTRNTLDLAAVPVLKSLSNYPVFVDPSHGVGLREFVPTMAMGALAVGADGLMIEVHQNPEEALSDGRQSLSVEEFKNLINKIKISYRIR